MANVLVFTPTWKTDTGTAMRPETAASVRAQVFSSFDWVIGLHNPYPVGDLRNVLAQYQDARKRMLDGDYDALLTVEHDMVLPEGAFQKLWDTAADIVYGVYMLRHGSLVLNAWEYTGGRNIGESLSLHPDKLAEARRQVVARVSGVGFGCTLIRRHVLEAIGIRPNGTDHDSPDVPLAIDALQEGFISAARFDVPCGHYDGDVLIPALGGNGMGLIKVTALQNVTAAGVRMEAGQQYTLPSDEASELALAGYVRIDDDAPETAALAIGETAMKPKGRKRG